MGKITPRIAQNPHWHGNRSALRKDLSSRPLKRPTRGARRCKKRRQIFSRVTCLLTCSGGPPIDRIRALGVMGRSTGREHVPESWAMEHEASIPNDEENGTKRRLPIRTDSRRCQDFLRRYPCVGYGITKAPDKQWLAVRACILLFA